MPAKIRVFVSSTMEDLANEREAVVDAIRDLNFEPVNAEGLLPNGSTSWEVLEREIQTSHICILIQGDRYGWVPTGGHGAHQNKSVTHLEVDAARRAGKPILPFFKKLAYGADATSMDAVRRDEFRNQVGDWTAGQFRAEFKRAKDLGTKVRQALLDVLATSWLRDAVKAEVGRTPFIRTSSNQPLAARPAAFPELLLAGAGLSLSAGMPSGSALAGVVGQALGLDPDQASTYSLAQLFELVELTFGRERMLEIVAGVLNPPVPVEPTSAHLAAVRRFPVILTTNYDSLFERACEMLELPYMVRTANGATRGSGAAQVTIFAIDGSIDDPKSLILSPSDADRARSDTTYWAEIVELLQTARPVVVGHSLRDGTSRWLLSRRNRNIRGVYVAPQIDPIGGKLLLDALNLEGVESSANDYLWSM